ncbi:hypothetical protein HanXRQr2_Chr16g0740711 [Helianthus annuus]|uniref:Uncharacterized protein n=1 Tax=Helianthus annuus TaxID=4232 RepID=A0A9K3DS03_HELAN|nr:hypothetical protein HanXRQr2_Chr16g0740711 [Helianthus annuus]KAJ0437603.1 hypothetical protein HanHA300_Chr16g0604061 [Helianthus annuus]KAJ0459930.1 hypothetical protein HanHA89_Chr16g0654701 [Helianthus annuus]
MCRLFMETIFQAVVLIMRLDFLHVQMLKARRTCSMTSFRMKTRREGTQKIVMIELSLTLHQHHKNLKN